MVEMVSRGTHLRMTLGIVALFILHVAAIAQQAPIAADQIISKHMEAVGASRFPTITSFVETGELSGSATNLWQSNRSAWQPGLGQTGVFESYFKAPNLRYYSSVNEKNQVIALYGCNGKISWHIDIYLKRTEFKPKPGNEGDCNQGFQATASRLNQSNAKIRLIKEKELEGRQAWEVKVDIPSSPVTETYYFDAETFLLLRIERRGTSLTYSDYREVGGIKFPFRIVQEFSNSKLITTVREVKVNVPLDDARFAEPDIKDGKILVTPVGAVSKTPQEPPPTVSATPQAADVEASKPILSNPAGTQNMGSAVEVNFPNFVTSPIEELQQIVPELKGLKPPPDQEKLAGILERVGAKIVEIGRNTPNLIARESVVNSPQQTGATKHDYDYLILPHIDGTMVRLDEFRLDLKSGDKFETDEALKTESSLRDSLQPATNETTASKGNRPVTQGFATSWVHFYPSNQTRASYRYLGEQKRDGHHTLVLAFAQKPELTLMPAVFRYQDKTVPMFMQGIAWIDPSDFRILRLRTDLLSPIPEISLQRLTADIQFALMRIEQVPSALPLPREVAITAVMSGAAMRELHEYSGYRLFRARSKIVPLP